MEKINFKIDAEYELQKLRNRRRREIARWFKDIYAFFWLAIFAAGVLFLGFFTGV